MHRPVFGQLRSQKSYINEHLRLEDGFRCINRDFHLQSILLNVGLRAYEQHLARDWRSECGFLICTG